jgi:PBP1b-binding outer membrane lipoprotein LpoB
MPYGKVLLIMVLGLMFVGCSKPDVNQFITRESFAEATVACEGSTDRLCRYRPAFVKAEKYCADNRMSDAQCNQVKDEITEEALSYAQEQIDEMNQSTEKLKRVTEERRRKNAK